MKGRPPTPTKLRLLQGNPGKRPLERDAINPPPAIPPCPEHLNAVAKAEWERVTVELHKLGVIPRTARPLAGRWFAVEAVRSGPCCSRRQC